MTEASASGMLCLDGGRGVAVPLDSGQALEIVNVHGSQVVDTWAISRADHAEHLSMMHTRRMLWKLIPQQGDVLWSNHRSPMLGFEMDTSPGAHDTLLDACDEWVYRSYGCAPRHPNCKTNFHDALGARGFALDHVPAPFNLFMRVAISDNQTLTLTGPASSPGDLVRVRALMDVIVVMSACPMDVTPVNGPDLTVRDVGYRVLDRPRGAG